MAAATFDTPRLSAAKSRSTASATMAAAFAANRCRVTLSVVDNAARFSRILPAFILHNAPKPKIYGDSAPEREPLSRSLVTLVLGCLPLQNPTLSSDDYACTSSSLPNYTPLRTYISSMSFSVLRSRIFSE